MSYLVRVQVPSCAPMMLGGKAGQSILHLHVHLIPRYDGDVPNPRGGARGIIPEKQSY